MNRSLLTLILVGSLVIHGYSQQSRAIASAEEIRDHFYNQSLILLDSNWICFDQTIFPLDEQRLFYISYIHSKETINKRLKSSDGCVMILRQELFTVDGTAIEPDSTDNFVLYYYHGERQVSEKLGSLRFNLEENQKYVNEIAGYLQKPNFKEKTEEELMTILSNLWKYKNGFIDNRSLKSLIYQARQTLE